jgi:CxxC-x17-CxxC domain-containing protein
MGKQNRSAREMHEAPCSWDDCEEIARVPFIPDGIRPVYCALHRNPDSRMYTAICWECDEEFQVKFKPNPNRPIYCPQCYQNKQVEAADKADQRWKDEQLQNRNKYTGHYAQELNDHRRMIKRAKRESGKPSRPGDDR